MFRLGLGGNCTFPQPENMLLQSTTQINYNVGGSSMPKGSPIGFRIEPEIKAALEKAAEDDERSLSSLITVVLKKWLIENRYLSK